MNRTALLCCAWLASAAGPACADHLGEPVGGWSVGLTYDREEEAYRCAGHTVNAAGQSLQVVFEETGSLSIHIEDFRWFFGTHPQNVAFGLQLTGQPLNMAGRAKGGSLASRLGGAETTPTFLQTLAGSDAITVLNGRGVVVASFPQSDAQAVADELMHCVEHLTQPNPMAGITNPF